MATACETGWVWMRILFIIQVILQSCPWILFPGHGKSGDLPPRPGFAEKWHPKLLKELPDIQLTLLIGQYAQAYYLHEKVSGKVTDRVHRFKDYCQIITLVHPSPRNQIWMKKNSLV